MKNPVSASPLRSRILRIAIALMLAVGALTPAAGASAVGEPTFVNPLVPDAADPTMEYYNGNYYLVATTWDNRVVMRKAATLDGLRTTKPIVVYSDTNAGRNANMWAPELKRLNGPSGWRWYLMYTMGTAGRFDSQHLHVIESAGDDPMGPYSYKGRPIPGDQWNIDGAYLELAGSLYTVWSQFSPDGLQSNYITKMTNPWTATGSPSILSQPEAAWEKIGGAVNEGPTPLQHDGSTWVVYSASYCGTEDYQLGTLKFTGTNPLDRNSWTKSPAPVFSKANGVYGPGHNDFFTSPDGTETWNVYHANARPDGGCARERSARVQPINWNASGTPEFGQPIAAGTAVRTPSGERGPITTNVSGATWKLVSRSSGQCAVTDGSGADGAALALGSCNSSGAGWKLDATGDGYLRLVNATSGKALDAANCGTANGTSLRQWSWLANACQQWSVTASSDGWSVLTNRAAGKVADVANCGTAVGTPVRLWSALNNACQDWSLQPAGAVTLTSVASGKSIDLPGCSSADGTVLQQWEWIGSTCQRVSFIAQPDGRFELHPANSPSKCLGVQSGSTADGATVVLGACGAVAGRWRLSVEGDGTVQLIAAHSGKALDLAGCSTASGARIAQWTALGNDCQRFRIGG